MTQPVRYVRRPFYVMAFQVTEENINKVAVWCGGTVRVGKPQGDIYIKVDKVLNPQTARQTMAFVGNYVLKSGEHFKVYTESSFDKSFKRAQSERV